MKKDTSVEWQSTGRQADKHIKYCLKCKKCWEHKFYSNRPTRAIYSLLYYTDFPTYKKIREVCIYCKKGVRK